MQCKKKWNNTIKSQRSSTTKSFTNLFNLTRFFLFRQKGICTCEEGGMKRKQEPKKKRFSQTYSFSKTKETGGKVPPYLRFGFLLPSVIVVCLVCYGGWLSFRGKQSATVMRVGEGGVSYMPSWQQGLTKEEHPNQPVILFPFQSTDINQAYLLTQDLFTDSNNLSKFSFLVSTNTKTPSDIIQILDELEVSSIALLCVIGNHNICLDFLSTHPEMVWGSLFFPTEASSPLSLTERLWGDLFSPSPETWEEWIQAYNRLTPQQGTQQQQQQQQEEEQQQASSTASSLLCSYLQGVEIARWSIISFQGEEEGGECHFAFESLDRRSNVSLYFDGFSSGQLLIW